jgi:hypothetical protein
MEGLNEMQARDLGQAVAERIAEGINDRSAVYRQREEINLHIPFTAGAGMNDMIETISQQVLIQLALL